MHSTSSVGFVNIKLYLLTQMFVTGNKTYYFLNARIRKEIIHKYTLSQKTVIVMSHIWYSLSYIYYTNIYSYFNCHNCIKIGDHKIHSWLPFRQTFNDSVLAIPMILSQAFAQSYNNFSSYVFLRFISTLFHYCWWAPPSH